VNALQVKQYSFDFWSALIVSVLIREFKVLLGEELTPYQCITCSNPVGVTCL